jgi:hypothetical protein
MLGVAAAGIAAATAVALASPAAGSTDGATAREGICNSDATLCNATYGGGTRVDYIEASRSSILGARGFFEVFGPNNYKKTDATTTQMERTIPISRNFPDRSLICLRFWRYDGPGHFTQVGGNVCTSIPIG